MSKKEDKHPSSRKDQKKTASKKEEKPNQIPKKDEKPKKQLKPIVPIHILGFAGETNKLSLVVQFESDQRFLVVPAESLEKHYPIELIDFLEKHITKTESE